MRESDCVFQLVVALKRESIGGQVNHRCAQAESQVSSNSRVSLTPSFAFYFSMIVRVLHVLCLLVPSSLLLFLLHLNSPAAALSLSLSLSAEQREREKAHVAVKERALEIVRVIIMQIIMIIAAAAAAAAARDSPLCSLNLLRFSDQTRIQRERERERQEHTF